MVVKLVPPSLERDNRRQQSLERAIERLIELKADVDGFAMVVILKDGCNLTLQTPLEDAAKMLGEIEILKADLMKTYQNQ